MHLQHGLERLPCLVELAAFPLDVGLQRLYLSLLFVESGRNSGRSHGHDAEDALGVACNVLKACLPLVTHPLELSHPRLETSQAETAKQNIKIEVQGAPTRAKSAQRLPYFAPAALLVRFFERPLYIPGQGKEQAPSDLRAVLSGRLLFVLLTYAVDRLESRHRELVQTVSNL